MKAIKKLQIGKNGLTPEFIEQVKSVFENGKLVKISILKSACRDKKDAEKIGKELILPILTLLHLHVIYIWTQVLHCIFTTALFSYHRIVVNPGE